MVKISFFFSLFQIFLILFFIHNTHRGNTEAFVHATSASAWKSTDTHRVRVPLLFQEGRELHHSQLRTSDWPPLPCRPHVTTGDGWAQFRIEPIAPTKWLHTYEKKEKCGNESALWQACCKVRYRYMCCTVLFLIITNVKFYFVSV